MTDLSWFWIAILLTVAPLLAVLIALPCWRRDEWILGNIAGTIVIFGGAMALIFRESAQLNLLTQECLDAGLTCWPEPSAFTRFAVYAVIGLVEVVALFTASLKVEDRKRKRRYAPEWR